jgi:hypothetical protein
MEGGVMFGRYRRLVPWAQRDLIKRHGLPKPNWYVGSAETVHMDREMRRAIDALKAQLAERRDTETP